MSDRRNTNKITSLTVGQARELVGRGRKLYFDGVESLTAEVARVLAGNECRLSLNRLSCLTKEGSTMGKCGGPLLPDCGEDSHRNSRGVIGFELVGRPVSERLVDSL
jgi:hypothetical protein